jgi:CheY-like chemotaxis protein
MAAFRALIVEDEAIVAWALRATLERWGISATSVEMRGADAIAAFDRDAPDLALLDIFLADAVDGIAVARHIREVSEVPFIFVTASQDSATRSRALLESPAAIVPKPYGAEELRRAVMEALGESA